MKKRKMLKVRWKRVLAGILCATWFLLEISIIDFHSYAAEAESVVDTGEPEETGTEIIEEEAVAGQSEEGQAEAEDRTSNEKSKESADGENNENPDGQQDKEECTDGEETESGEVITPEEQGESALGGEDADSKEEPDTEKDSTEEDSGQNGDSMPSVSENTESAKEEDVVAGVDNALTTSADDIASGIVDESYGHIEWVIDKNGKLTVSGTGDFASTGTGHGRAPWYNYRTSIKYAEVNVSSMTVASYMFEDCENLEVIDLNNFYANEVKTMYRMFDGCSNLNSLDLSGLDIGNVRNMNSMFINCSSLSSINLRGLDTSNVRDMGSVFKGCSNLDGIDLSGLNTNNVTNMYRMFEGCSSLASIELDGFSTENVTNMLSMFNGCSSLLDIDVSNFNTENVTTMSDMFQGCSSLTSIDLGSFNTGNVTYMSGMFSGCHSLTSIDLSGFNTEKVCGMGAMFYDCTSLTNIDLSNFVTSSLTDMAQMFYDCSSLISLELNSFDTRSVTRMCSMFHGCKNLINVDLNNFNTGNVTDMSAMFYDCNSLTSVDLSSFDTGSVTDVDWMFTRCSCLNSIDLSEFDFSRVVNMDFTFSGCDKLTTIYAPYNVTNTCILPAKSGDFWYRSDGITVTELPRNLNYSVTLGRNYIPTEKENNIYIDEESNHKYQLFDTSMEWEKAKEYCEGLGGHLVTITSEKEQKFVTEIAKKSKKKNIWLGAELVSKKFTWITGEKFEYTNWNRGEPNNDYNNEDTIMMYTYYGTNSNGYSITPGVWNDESKHGRDWTNYTVDDMGFICEWDPVEDITDHDYFNTLSPTDFKYIEEHVNYYKSSYDTDIVSMGSTVGLGFVLEDLENDLTYEIYKDLSISVAEIDFITSMWNAASYIDITWSDEKKFNFKVPDYAVNDLANSEFSVVLYQLLANDTVYKGIQDTFSINYKKNICSFGNLLSKDLQSVVRDQNADNIAGIRKILRQSLSDMSSADLGSVKFAEAYTTYEKNIERYLDLAKTRRYFKDLSSYTGDAFSIFGTALGEIESIGKAYQYMCWAESYAETNEEFKTILLAVADKADERAQLIRRDPHWRPCTSPYNADNMCAGLSKAIRSFIETMDKYTENSLKAFKDEVIDKTGETCVELFGDKSGDVLTALICPELEVINKAFEVVDAGTKTTKLVIDLLTGIDDEYKKALTVESFELMTVFLKDVSKSYGELLVADKIIDSSQLPSLVEPDPQTRLKFALMFDETIKMYKNSMLLACDYAIMYEESKLAHASKMAGSVPDMWYDSGATTPWQMQASESSLAINLLSFQKPQIADIHCHDDGLIYDSSTGHFEYNKPVRVISIACPVNVTVLNPVGQQLAFLTNGSAKVASGYESYFLIKSLDEEENDYVKVVIIPFGEDYQVLIDGTDDGTMSVFVGKYDGNNITEVETFANFHVTNETNGYLDSGDENNTLGYLTLNGEIYGKESQDGSQDDQKRGIHIVGLKETYEYTGSKIIPDIGVMDYDADGGKLLVPGTDYTVKYKSNTKVGIAELIVTGKGNYSGKDVSARFTIKETENAKVPLVSLKGARITILSKKLSYDGEVKYPDFVLTLKGGAGKQYKYDKKRGVYTADGNSIPAHVTLSNNINKGTATILLKGTDNTKVKKTFKIAAVDLSLNAAKVEVKATSGTYAVKGATPASITVTYNGNKLKNGTDYTVKYSSNKRVTTSAKIVITGKGNYANKCKKTYEIKKLNLKKVKVSAVTAYAGLKAGKVKATVVDGRGNALNASQYTLHIYKNKTETSPCGSSEILEAGSKIYVTAEAKDKQNLEGTTPREAFDVSTNIAKAKVKNSSGGNTITKQYTGSPIIFTKENKDELQVTLSGKELIMGNDYEIVSYSSNINKGTATAVIKGIGSYSGTKTFKFKIIAKKMQISGNSNWDDILNLIRGLMSF